MTTTVQLHRPAGRPDADGRPPLVLLAPFPFDAWIWQDVAERLGGDVITVDPPGFGGEASDEPSLEAYARAVLTALDAEGVDRFVVAGNSMGGYVALALADLAPERIAGIGLVGTKSLADDGPARAKRLTTAERAEAGVSASELVGDSTAEMLSADTLERLPETVAEVQRRLDSAPTDGIAWALRAMAARPERTDVLARVGVPALILHGEQDALMGAEPQQVMADALQIEVTDLPGVGHLVPVEAPAETAEALQQLWDAAR